MKKSFALAIAFLFAASLIVSGAGAAYGRHDVLYPIGRQMSEIKDVAPSLPDLNGKTICELWNYVFRGDETFAVIGDMLKKAYPAVNVIPYAEFDNTHGPNELVNIAALPDKLKAAGCDAVISGNGG